MASCPISGNIPLSSIGLGRKGIRDFLPKKLGRRNTEMFLLCKHFCSKFFKFGLHHIQKKISKISELPFRSFLFRFKKNVISSPIGMIEEGVNVGESPRFCLLGIQVNIRAVTSVINLCTWSLFYILSEYSVMLLLSSVKWIMAKDD